MTKNYDQSHPSFRLPVDGTAVFTAIRQQDGMLGRPVTQGRLAIHPSVQPSWTGTVTIPKYCTVRSNVQVTVTEGRELNTFFVVDG
jgi:hypothetical protein